MGSDGMTDGADAVRVRLSILIYIHRVLTCFYLTLLIISHCLDNLSRPSPYIPSPKVYNIIRQPSYRKNAINDLPNLISHSVHRHHRHHAPLLARQRSKPDS